MSEPELPTKRRCVVPDNYRKRQIFRNADGVIRRRAPKTTTLRITQFHVQSHVRRVSDCLAAEELTAVVLLSLSLIYINCSDFECHHTWFSITQTRKSNLLVYVDHGVISYIPMRSFWKSFIFPLIYLFFPFRYPLPWQENPSSRLWQQGWISSKFQLKAEISKWLDGPNNWRPQEPISEFQHLY